MAINSKKLYAIKKTKTGRQSIVQVLNTSKGKVYASTKRKLGSNTKTFKTKASAKKHIKTSSFGKKETKAPPGQGYIACVNPSLDEEKPQTYFKVFKVYTYKIGDDKIKIFHSKTDSGQQQYWQLPDDSDSLIKVRKTKETANKDKIKLGRLRNANVLQSYIPVPCSEEYLKAIGQSGFFSGGGGGGGGGSSGSSIKLPPAYANLLGKENISVGNSNQIRIGQAAPSNLEAIFGFDPSVHGMSRGLLENLRKQQGKPRMSSSSILKAVNRNLSQRKYPSTIADTFDDVRKLDEVRANPMFEGAQTSSSVRQFLQNRTGKEFSNFGRRSYFGSIPTFGKYAYPVDPALKRLIAQSSFGRPYGYGNSFGRINYGFSRYF